MNGLSFNYVLFPIISFRCFFFIDLQMICKVGKIYNKKKIKYKMNDDGVFSIIFFC